MTAFRLPDPKGVARALSPAHFAFMRAIVQGLDLRDSWVRFLGQSGEVPENSTLRAEVARMRAVFAAAAHRARRSSVARLVLIETHPQVPEDAAPPSLEEFAEQHGLSDFSVAEQLLAYTAKWGVASASVDRRRERLIARQLEALRWLESQTQHSPTNGDLITDWLSERLCTSLSAVGIHTLAHLVEWINTRGDRWTRRLRAVGPVKGQVLLSWLTTHGLLLTDPRATDASPLKPSSPSSVATDLPRRGAGHSHAMPAVPATGVRPLEWFVPPSDLPKIRDDIDALVNWVLRRGPQLEWHPDGNGVEADTCTKVTDCGTQLMSDTPQASAVRLSVLRLTHTQRAYRKEGERFLLWCALIKRRTLADITRADCSDYLDFLCDPSTSWDWCGARSGQRWERTWRPFEGGLSPSSRALTRRTLRAWMAYLVETGYLGANPWDGTAVLPASAEGDVLAPPPRHAVAVVGREGIPWPAEASERQLARAYRQQRALLAQRLRTRYRLSFEQLSHCTRGDLSRWCSLANSSVGRHSFQTVVTTFLELQRLVIPAVVPSVGGMLFLPLPQTATSRYAASNSHPRDHLSASTLRQEVRRWCYK